LSRGEFGKVVSYTYTAAGEKLRMATSTGETRDYRTQTEYLNGQLVYQQTPEGRVVVGGSVGRHEYFHTDYLGNIRAVYYDSSGIVKLAQYQDYDPWGMALPGLSGGGSTNRYKFNGKEAIAEMGPGMLDFGARLYESSATPDSIGRMHTVDRAAEMFSRVSGYSFGLNNPVYNIDPTGDTTVPAATFNISEATFNVQNDVVLLDGVTITGQRNGRSSGGGSGSGSSGWGSSGAGGSYGEPASSRTNANGGLSDAEISQMQDNLEGDLTFLSNFLLGTRFGEPKSDIIETSVPIPFFMGGPAPKLFKAAITPLQGAVLTNAGRAVTKHPQYFGYSNINELRNVVKGDNAINTLTSQKLKEILRNGIRTEGSGGRYPEGWITYTLPNGYGASWHSNGTFVGFRGPR